MECFVIAFMWQHWVAIVFLSRPEVSHSFPRSMFAHMIRLDVRVCVRVQTPPGVPSIIVTARQQFWVLVPLSVFQDGSRVKHFPVNSQYCWLYVSCKMEQMNHRASENSAGPDDIPPVFSLKDWHLSRRSNYATRSMRTFIVCFHVLTQNPRTSVCWFKLNLYRSPQMSPLTFILLIESVILQLDAH